MKTADSSHLSLQGNVIVKPLEGIQQRLSGIWNFAGAENRDRAICVNHLERKPEGEKRDRLLAKQMGQCWCGHVATRYK